MDLRILSESTLFHWNSVDYVVYVVPMRCSIGTTSTRQVDVEFQCFFCHLLSIRYFTVLAYTFIVDVVPLELRIGLLIYYTIKQWNNVAYTKKCALFHFKKIVLPNRVDFIPAYAVIDPLPTHPSRYGDNMKVLEGCSQKTTIIANQELLLSRTMANKQLSKTNYSQPVRHVTSITDDLCHLDDDEHCLSIS